MAAPRRRSARISRKSTTPDGAMAKKTPHFYEKLGSLVERDETPENGPQSTLNAIVSSPTHPVDTATDEQLAELSTTNTPKTLPRVAFAEMHPKEVHQTTTKAPDSGLRLGFIDVAAAKSSNFVARTQGTPSKTGPRASLPPHLTSAGFDFKFASESHLSEEARKVMDEVRGDAERIKLQVLAEKNMQDRRDNDAERLFSGVSATGRKIARPQGKAGRFSDVHMAQFKKMDSIANHPSAFRAKPNFAQPTQQSLKRSGSKAGLDEADRPRTAGKGTPGKAPPPFGRGHVVPNPQKPLPSIPSESNRLENDAPAKRRKSAFGDVSSVRAAMKEEEEEEEEEAVASRPSTLPRPKTAASTSLHNLTKLSVARPNSSKSMLASPSKLSFLSRSNSVKSLQAAVDSSSSDETAPKPSPPRQLGLVRSESTKSIRPLPPLPTQASALPENNFEYRVGPKALPAIPNLTSSPSKSSLASRLPTFQGLKSILRPSRRATSRSIQSPVKDSSAGGTPKRNNAVAQADSSSTKKVDFTPSTKSRYAVKLAAASPSPSKLHQASRTIQPGLLVPYDPSAYTVDGDGNDEEWESAESEIDYPVLHTGDDHLLIHSPTAAPAATAISSFTQKAKDHSRRESKEFKSIFTTLEHPSRSTTPTTLTAVNTNVNVRSAGVISQHYKSIPQQATNVVTRSPGSSNVHANIGKPSPSTIRRVRSSGASTLIQPFEDTIKTVPHGLPGKKRRRESEMQEAKQQRQHQGFDNRAGGEEGKENRNRRESILPVMPGAWDDGARAGAGGEKCKDKDEAVDEGDRRGGKRARVDAGSGFGLGRGLGKGDAEKPKTQEGVKKMANVLKKPNKAREAAARSAKERKEGLPAGKAKGDRTGSVGGAARGILSMARLNMLSRPKERR